MQRFNLSILVTSQLISATGSIVMVTLGGIIGAQLASTNALATLPVTAMVIAVAASTVPATLLMQRIGRPRGFALASMTAVIAVLVAMQALRLQSFGLFTASLVLFGINMAFTQQYRYAASESVDTKHVARAISLVLLGSIGGALVGPELATRGQGWLDGIPFGGTMLALAAAYTIQALLLVRLKPSERYESLSDSGAGRTLPDLARQPVFVVAILGGTAGYGVMTLIMTATPLSMHVNDGHSLEQTASVIRAHVLAMYLPSLVSGFLIERLGVSRLMSAGALLLLVTSIIGLQGQSVMHYWWALVMLGVGWNFLYVGGTTMLTYTYSPEERFRAQAVNEFLVFGTSATASMLAGAMMHYFGWLTLMWMPVPLLVITLLALVLVRRQPELKRA
ncbi:MAG: MFS transporter [Pseudomonadota bacterium]